MAAIPESPGYSNWTDALAGHPIFAHLSEECCNNDERIAVCQSRGDLFVWDPKSQLIMTTNLKRLHVRISSSSVDIEDESISPLCFQYLHPIIVPATPPTRLVSSPNSRYLAVIGTHYLYVIELWRQRGPNGEFSGGVAEVDCRTIPIGDTLIRAHRLSILQVEWHPEENGTLAVLSNDGGLRLFRVSSPAVPFLSLPVSKAHPTFTRLLCLDQSGIVICFSFASKNILLLQDTMDVQTIPIKDGEQPTAPLPMYPMDKDNYSDTAIAMLFIWSRPPLIVMATTTGRLLHCIFLDLEDSDDEENEIVDQDGTITVVENVELGFEGDFIRFLSDPLLKYTYYILTSAAVYSMQLPWLQNLEQFGFDGVQFSANPPSTDNVIYYSTDHCISDGALMVDSVLGMSLIITTTNGECIPISLDQPSFNMYQSSFLSQSSQESVLEPQLENHFVSHITNLLNTPKTEHPLPKKLKPGATNKSQKECFQFLQESLIALRQRFIAPQQTAAAKLNGRIQSLVKRRERHITQLISFEEECEAIREASRELELKIERLKERHQEQVTRIEKILATVTTSSPILSDAEKTLAKDLTTIKEQIEPLKFALSQANSKVLLGLSKSDDTKLSLSADKLDVILTSLTDDGSTIKNSIKTVKNLAEELEIDVSQTNEHK